MTLSNHVRLDEISGKTIKEIAELPIDQLALLQDEAEHTLQNAKGKKDRLDSAVALRFSGQAQTERRAKGKDTGTVRLTVGDFVVVADLPKKVFWDQKRLAELVAEIKAGGDDPTEYLETAYKVPERKYTAWPAYIRTAFEPARTVRPGKPSFRIERGKETR